MTVKVHILDLQMIGNIQDEPNHLLLIFTGERIKVTKQVAEGIVLWMRANEHNGGYYSLDLGDYTLEASRPYKNHHSTHQERLAKKLARFKPWFLTNKKLVVRPNQYNAGGIVMHEGDKTMRIFRKKNKDYRLELSQFFPHIQEKK